MNLPTIINRTKLTRTIEAGGKVFKVKKRRGGQTWSRGSQSVVKGWRWDCDGLGLHGATRLQMEAALLRAAGNDVDAITESHPEFVL